MTHPFIDSEGQKEKRLVTGTELKYIKIPIKERIRKS